MACFGQADALRRMCGGNLGPSDQALSQCSGWSGACVEANSDFGEDQRVLASVTRSPLWWEADDARPHDHGEPAHRLPSKGEIAVIGGGYSGLSAALTLARSGCEVFVLDAEAPGFGCSTRNGGLVGPSFHKLGLAGLRAAYGEEKAASILAESMDALEFLKSFIGEENIGCHFEESGRFRGARRPADYDSLARQAQDLERAVGLRFDMVPRSDQRREIGSDHYFGGIVYHQDGHLQPALYLKGLVRCCERAGVRLFSGAPVTGISREGGGFALKVAGKVLSAQKVLLTTNGYTGAAFPYFRRRVIPLRSAIIATEPLGRALIRELSPRNRGFGETSRLVLYYRPTPDGERMVFGGRALDLADRPERYVPDLFRLLTRIFPQLEGKAVTHAWSGTVAYTFDHAPHIGEAEGIFFAMGYCGSGVGRATYFGRKVALKMLGHAGGRTSLDDLAFDSRPLYGGTPWFLPAMLRWHALMDRFGI